jgi:hypothetical protein
LYLTARVGIQPCCNLGATAEVTGGRYVVNRLTAGHIAMISCVMGEGRLFGLTPFDWSVLLGSSTLCALLTQLL